MNSQRRGRDDSTAGSFGSALRRLRISVGLSQAELAERSGLSVRGIGALEQGRRHAPHLATVRLLADALGLDDAKRAGLLTAARPEAAADPPVTRRPLARMPLPSAALIGREAELIRACATLRRPEVRLLTLLGPGGVGKTRLAIAIANALATDFPGGTAFVDLSPVREPDLVAPTVARALGMTDDGERALTERLRARIADQPLLLLLDNFEQVIDAGAWVAELAGSSPQLKLLVTSRIPLRVSLEHLFPLSPLPLPAESEAPEDLGHNPAVTLFVQRAQAVRPDLKLQPTNAAAITGVVRRLDGLPLAIELAAARVRFLSPQALLSRMPPRLPMLDSVRRDVPARQRTMEAAIAWSYDLLSVAEQSLFRRLAVFDGGFSLEAAIAVARELDDLRPDLERRLETLVDHNLLQLQFDPAAETRLLMLETIREYAANQLTTRGEEAAAKNAHAAYYRALVERHARAGWTRYDSWLPHRFESNLPNLRSALTWLDESGDAEGVQQMAGALRWFWSARGYVPEGRMWLERGLARSNSTTSAIRGRATVALAQFAYFQGDEPLARKLFTEGLALHRADGDPVGQAFALSALGALAHHRREFDDADALLNQALVLADEASDREIAASLVAATISNLAQTAYARADLIRASDLSEQALARYRALDFVRGIINNLHLSANILRDRGYAGDALQRFQESLAMAHEHDDQRHFLVLLESIARIATSTNQPHLAVRLFSAAATMREQSGYQMQDPTEPSPLPSAIAAARTGIGEDAFAIDWEAGRDLSRDEALAEALAIVLPVSDTVRPYRSD